MLDDRFWNKVEKSSPNGCWEWRANKNNKGYGLFRPGGTAPKRLAHRLAFEDASGRPIPDGLHILHSCDNPACVNPAHLRAGTRSENMQDMDKRGRRVPNGLRGETVATSKLKNEQVIALRRDYVAGVALDVIADRYGISEFSIADFINGRSWKHLLGVPGSPTLAELKSEAARRRRSSAKISLETARAIRRRLAKGELGKDLAVEYGLHKATISDIKLQKIWPD